MKKGDWLDRSNLQSAAFSSFHAFIPYFGRKVIIGDSRIVVREANSISAGKTRW